ncbi:hypothetical protein ACFFPJ_07335 [Microbacterium terregens]|uniref:Uncharacterized protein n=1 Tax=Microbacterium terregens TaxID=69363 RepID=A0ABV5T150_9MICO
MPSPVVAPGATGISGGSPVSSGVGDADSPGAAPVSAGRTGETASAASVTAGTSR